ncbi:DUF4234 domain-containing protein [Streptomyces sp. NPDC052396]|uniref:DUF4234 domain-containing protein n=1 Tax=Streptomyces sp. NPDC052396 TaxID=3365689 RepID=UPI0037D729DF
MTTPPQWGQPGPNPYQQMPAGYGYPAPAAPVGYPAPAHYGLAMKRRGPWAVWFLVIITLGIYSLVWYFKIHKEMAEFDSRRKISPAGSMLTIWFGWYLLIPPFVSYYNTGKRICDAQRAAGLPQTCSGGLGLFLVFIFGTHSVYYQSELNKVVDHYGQVPPGTQVPLAA